MICTDILLFSYTAPYTYVEMLTITTYTQILEEGKALGFGMFSL